ncbi:MAG: hypothetical protein R3F51_22070 [Cyanobacteriota/Melainabacteria group bacterium]
MTDFTKILLSSHAEHDLTRRRFLGADGNPVELNFPMEQTAARYCGAGELESRGLDMVNLGIAIAFGFDIDGFCDKLAADDDDIASLNGMVTAFVEGLDGVDGDADLPAAAFGRLVSDRGMFHMSGNPGDRYANAFYLPGKGLMVFGNTED